VSSMALFYTFPVRSNPGLGTRLVGPTPLKLSLFRSTLDFWQCYAAETAST
jgi:hypothetical protein